MKSVAKSPDLSTPTPTPYKEIVESKKKIEDEEDDSDISEDVMILQTEEDQEAIEELQLMKLSRLMPRRHLWDSKAGSYYVILAFLLGYDSIICYMHQFDRYGLWFTAAYIVAMVFIGFPLLYMELALGQFTSCNAYSVFKQMAPAMAGIGVVGLVLNFFIMITDHSMMHYFLSLFSNAINIFTNAHPWHSCHNDFNDADCREIYHSCERLQKQYKDMSWDQIKELGHAYKSIGTFCYQTELLYGIPDATETHWNLKEIGQVNFAKWLTGESMGQFLLWNIRIDDKTLKYVTWPTEDYIINMFLAWMVVYGLCVTGKKVVSNLARFTIVFTLAGLIFFIYVFFFVSPPEFAFFDILRSANYTDTHLIIANAVICVLLSLRIGQGGLVYLGSQYQFRNAPAMDCVIIVVVTSLFPLLYTVGHSMFLDSYMLGLVEGDQDLYNKASYDQKNIYFYRTGHRLVHTTLFMQALKQLKQYEPFMVGLFSAMGILLSVMNKVVRAEIIVSTITEVYPAYANRLGRRMFFHLVICISYGLTFLFVSEDGLEMMVSLENFIYPLMTVCIILAELFTVCWCYGGKRLIVNIMTMTNRRNQDVESKELANFSRMVIIGMWAFVIPLLLIISLAIVLKFTEIKLRRPTDPPVLIGLGIIAIIPVTILRRVFEQYSRSKNWKPVFRPNPDLWGPRSAEDRKQTEKLEKRFRTL